MHEDQIHVDILSGEQRGLSEQLVDSALDGIAQQKRGESILYIFSAIEQSPRSVDRQTPQRAPERLGWRGGEEQRQRSMVWCVRGECWELPWPWPGAPLSKGLCGWAQQSRRSLLVGTRRPGSPSIKFCQIWHFDFRTSFSYTKTLTECTLASKQNVWWNPCYVPVAFILALKWSQRRVSVHNMYNTVSVEAQVRVLAASL